MLRVLCVLLRRRRSYGIMKERRTKNKEQGTKNKHEVLREIDSMNPKVVHDLTGYVRLSQVCRALERKSSAESDATKKT